VEILRKKRQPSAGESIAAFIGPSKKGKKKSPKGNLSEVGGQEAHGMPGRNFSHHVKPEKKKKKREGREKRER